ncbi:MAG TPA: hypothetical protein VG389_16515 [Myxococcota bacterium]|jgi:hypothetical protein|nr:hypothetical protein [Myxococcota bacterium]
MESGESRQVARCRARADLTVSADVAYTRFCDVEHVNDWLPHVHVKAVQQRYPTGLAEVVLFESEIQGARVTYTLKYVYDLKGKRVAWRTPEIEARVFRGNAGFVPRPGGGCELQYAIYEPTGDASMHARTVEERTAYAETVVEAFKRWVEGPTTSPTKS